MIAGLPLRGQTKVDKRSNVKQLEVKRTKLQDYLRGSTVMEYMRGKQATIELRDGAILSGRVRRIEHAEYTSTLFLKMRGMKEPEPIPVDRIETISYRGRVSKAGMVGVSLVMLPGAYGAEGATESGFNLFVGSVVAALALGLLLHVKRPHVVIRVVP
jgi:hypothetical protein